VQGGSRQEIVALEERLREKESALAVAEEREARIETLREEEAAVQAELDAVKMQLNQSSAHKDAPTKIALMKVLGRFHMRDVGVKARALWVFHSNCLESHLYDNYEETLAVEKEKLHEMEERMRQDHRDDGVLNEHTSTDRKLKETEDKAVQLRRAVREEQRASAVKDNEISDLKEQVKSAEAMAQKEKERATRTLAASRKRSPSK